jgi:serine protease Do
VVVTEVDPNGRTAEKGLSAAGVILDIGGNPIGTPADVHHAIGQAQRSGGHDILMRVQTTEHEFLFVAVPIAARHQAFWGRSRSWIHSP